MMASISSAISSALRGVRGVQIGGHAVHGVLRAEVACDLHAEFLGISLADHGPD